MNECVCSGTWYPLRFFFSPICCASRNTTHISGPPTPSSNTMKFLNDPISQSVLRACKREAMKLTNTRQLLTTPIDGTFWTAGEFSLAYLFLLKKRRALHYGTGVGAGAGGQKHRRRTKNSSRKSQHVQTTSDPRNESVCAAL